MTSKFSSAENAVYLTIWFSACFYSLQKLITAQTDILASHPWMKFSFRDLNPGWKVFNRLKDESDVEWSTWLYLVKLSWFFMIVQFFISEILRRTKVSLLKYWYILSSVIFIFFYMGTKQLFIIVSQPTIFWVVILFGGRRISVWVTSLIILAGYNSLKYLYDIWYIFESENDEEVFLLLFVVAWIELRCISYCLNYVEKEEKNDLMQDKSNSNSAQSIFVNILDLFSYVLYLPVLFTGPIIVYEEYEKSFHVENGNLLLKLKKFIWDMILYLIYTLLLEVSFHFIYFYAMQSNIEVLKKFPSVALCGGGLWMGLEFHMKYVISYGTTSAFARLDNIDAPPTPRCIARIHVYSQMWRYFDVGLYRFLFMYIYLPVYKSLKQYITLSKTGYKLMSSFATFIFIFMWHGTTWKIFVWSVLNYIGILLENCGRAIASSERYKWFKDNILRTDAMEVRFTAMICAPLLCMSAVSSFYLFSGSDIGYMYFNLSMSPSLFNFAFLYLCLYANCQVAIALQDIPSRTDTKKEKTS